MSNIWMPLYVADYLGDTGHLSTLEHGAYLLLIMHYWQKEAPLPDNDKTLAQIARLRVEHWRKIRPQLEGFFAIKLRATWTHDVIERELKKVAELKEKKRQAGIASGNSRSARVQQMQEQQGQQNGNHPPSPSPDRKIIDFSFNRVGGRKGVEMTPDNKLALFHNWLAPLLGNDGWQIIGRAMDPGADGYSVAVAFCKKTARENGKGWPHQWPTKSAETPVFSAE